MNKLFPGMDPYLESKEFWQSFHHVLADEIMTQLNLILGDRYFADVEVATMLEEVGISQTDLIYPDAAILETQPQSRPETTAVAAPAAPIQRVAVPAGQIRQRAVYVYQSESKRLVTAIEILSPFNKRSYGLERYRQKRDRILHSQIHLVEIDLLRGGQRPGWEVIEPPLDTDYVCLINRATVDAGRVSDIWPVALNEAIPPLPIPLLPPDPDVTIDLNQIIRIVYQRAAYARRVDYRQPVPPPALRPAMQRWLESLKPTR